MHIPELVIGKTVFVFDEVQDCPRALLSLKTNSNDRRYDFIASGSYLGVNGYAINAILLNQLVVLISLI